MLILHGLVSGFYWFYSWCVGVMVNSYPAILSKGGVLVFHGGSVGSTGSTTDFLLSSSTPLPISISYLDLGVLQSPQPHSITYHQLYGRSMVYTCISVVTISKSTVPPMHYLILQSFLHVNALSVLSILPMALPLFFLFIFRKHEFHLPYISRAFSPSCYSSEHHVSHLTYPS